MRCSRKRGRQRLPCVLTSGARRSRAQRADKAPKAPCYDSRQPAFEDRDESGLALILWYGLLHLQPGFAATELEGGSVVLEPGFLVGQVPPEGWLLDAGEPGKRLSDTLSLLCPAHPEGGVLGGAQGVSPGGPLPTGRSRSERRRRSSSRPGSRGGRGGRGASTEEGGSPFSPAPHVPQQPGELHEGGAEGRPVLQVEGLTDLLAELRGLRSPRAAADGLVPSPRGGAGQGIGERGARCRRGGDRSPRSPCPRSRPTPRRRAWSACPLLERVRRASPS